MSASRGRSLLKTLPGLLISAFFLWYTFRGISFAQIRSLHFVHPAWILGVLAFTAASYTLRCVRWTRMLRPVGARFATCARVLMTSLAANNILPLRIGDIMRCLHLRRLTSAPRTSVHPLDGPARKGCSTSSPSPFSCYRPLHGAPSPTTPTVPSPPRCSLVDLHHRPPDPAARCPRAGAARSAAFFARHHGKSPLFAKARTLDPPRP